MCTVRKQEAFSQTAAEGGPLTKQKMWPGAWPHMEEYNIFIQLFDQTPNPLMATGK